MNVDENDPGRTERVKRIEEVLDQDEKAIEHIDDLVREAERKAEELDKPSI
jgi:hypothetical protein